MKKPIYNPKYYNNKKIFQGFVNDFINFFGYEIKYIEKTYLNEDYLLGEYNFSKLEKFYDLICYIKDGLYTSHILNTNLINLVKNDLTIYISKTDWREKTDLETPRIEDLIYIDFLNGLYEIKSIEIETMMFYHCNFYAYEIYLENYNFYPDKIERNIKENIQIIKENEINSDFIYELHLDRKYNGELLFYENKNIDILDFEKNKIMVKYYIPRGVYLKNKNKNNSYMVVDVNKIKRDVFNKEYINIVENPFLGIIDDS